MSAANLVERLRKLKAYGCCTEAADRIEALEEQVAQAQSVIRQVSLDTFGEELSVKEFADRSSYDS